MLRKPRMRLRVEGLGQHGNITLFVLAFFLESGAFYAVFWVSYPSQIYHQVGMYVDLPR